MKSYPSIPTINDIPRTLLQQNLYVFDKLDGSNIRVEWDQKQGFTRFGSRKKMLTEEHPSLSKAITLFHAKYGEPLTTIFKDQKWKKAVVFFEFHGPSSFAGEHVMEDQHDVTLFDVSVDTRGLLGPNRFVELFQGLDLPQLLHVGEVDEEYIARVQDGTLEGMTREGVVVKGPHISPGRPFMVKIKNLAWISDVRTKYAGNTSELVARL